MSDGAPISPNARRWLNTISFAEGTWGGKSPRYAITFGYQPIADLSRHPGRVVKSGGVASAAAGAYQFMPSTWGSVQRQLNLPDFGPQSQDLAALELIKQRGVDPDRDPINPQNIAKLSGEWASLPTMKGTSAYGQPVKSASSLIQFASSPTSQGATRSGEAKTQQANDFTARSASLLDAFIKRLSSVGSFDSSAIPYETDPALKEEPVTREEVLELFAAKKPKTDSQSAAIEQGLLAAAAKRQAQLDNLMAAVQSSFRIDPRNL